MNYSETLDFLFNSLPVFQNEGSSAYKPGLERSIEFNRYLGSPDRSFLTIHVAGTNGKGSVSHILASVLQSVGYRVGLYTSPHLKDFRERIKVDGRMIPECEVVAFTESHRAKMLELELSFFEMTVGMAFNHFEREQVEVAVIETGLGGRLDSTNIISPELSIITNIGMDHMALLGDTIEKIAFEKAGIIKRGVPIVIGETNEQSAPVFIEKARQMDSPIVFADQTLHCISAELHNSKERFEIERISTGVRTCVELDLLGDYQRKNIITALTAIDVMNSQTHISVSRRAIICGCSVAAAETGLNGRWQILSEHPLTVCDTGHNEHGLSLVVEQIERQKYKRLYMIVGFVNDKDIEHILPLLPRKAHYIFTQASVRRALAATELAAAAARFGLEGEVVATVKGALERAQSLATPDDMIFIGGSTFTVAEL